MTVRGPSSVVSVMPSTSERPPRRRCQNSWLSTMTELFRRDLPRRCRRGRAQAGRPARERRRPRHVSPAHVGGWPLTIIGTDRRPDHAEMLERSRALAPGDEVGRGDHVPAACRRGWFPTPPRSRSGSWYGSGSSITVRTTLKIAEVAPMPRASVTSAAAVKPGARRSDAAAMAEIAHRVLEQRRPDLVARALLDALQPAELEQRLAPGLVRAHAGAAILLGLLIDVKANLFVETALERVAALTDRTDPLPACL